jgi:hypothetical protein
VPSQLATRQFLEPGGRQRLTLVAGPARRSGW